jgi:hypothetical protein
LDKGSKPREDFYDGYVVNAIMDAALLSARSKQWEPVQIDDWRGASDADMKAGMKDYDAQHYLIKEERMPDGTTKYILKEKASGKIIQKVV